MKIHLLLLEIVLLKQISTAGKLHGSTGPEAYITSLEQVTFPWREPLVTQVIYTYNYISIYEYIYQITYIHT